jgi:hypothetical protein
MAVTAFYVDKDNVNASNLNSGSTTGAPVTYAAGTFVRATGVYTVASGDPSSNIAVGDFVSIYTTAGATQPGLVARVTAVNATTVTVSLTFIAGATTNVSEAAGAATLKKGGPWAGMSGAVAFPFGFVTSTLRNVAGDPMRVYIKKAATAYSITAGMTHGASNGGTSFEGYTTTPGDGGIPEINGIPAAVANPFVALELAAEGTELANLWFNGNHDTVTDFGAGVATGNGVINISARAMKFRRVVCTAGWRSGLVVGGASSGGGHVFDECLFYDNQRDDANDFGNVTVNEESTFNYCTFIGSGMSKHAARDGHDSTAVRLGNDRGEPVTFNHCIFADSQASAIEFAGDSPAILNHCVLWNNGIANGHGLDLSAAGTSVFRIVINNTVIGNHTTGYGILGDVNLLTGPHLNKVAFYSNASGNTSLVNDSFTLDTVTLTADPFVDSAGYDFTPNDVAGGGALLKNAGTRALLGLPTAFTTLLTSYQNIGAVQHEETAGGGDPDPGASSETVYAFWRRSSRVIRL